MCEGQEQEGGEEAGHQLGPQPAVTLGSSFLRTWRLPGAFLLLGPPFQMREDVGDFESDFPVLISHFLRPSFAFSIKKVFLPVKKEGGMLNQLRKPGF